MSKNKIDTITNLFEGSQLYEKIVQLKMKSQKDGKNYLTDTLDTEGIFK